MLMCIYALLIYGGPPMHIEVGLLDVVANDSTDAPFSLTSDVWGYFGQSTA